MDILYVTHLLNGLLMIAIPVTLALWLMRRFHLSGRLFWIGAATFIGSQVLHIPFNNLLNSLFVRGILPLPPKESLLAFNAIVAGLSAGIFEETARYIMYRWFAKDARSWSKGLLLGAGHGGIEAIILGGLVLYTYIQMVALRNVDLVKTIPPDQLSQTQAALLAYWTLPWYTSLLGALERISAITAHLALSIMVLQVFLRKQPLWLLGAILWHALMDAIAVYGSGTLGAYATEGLLLGYALLSLGWIFWLRSPEPTPQPIMTSHEAPPPVFKVHPAEETPESLDRTRYQG